MGAKGYGSRLGQRALIILSIRLNITIFNALRTARARSCFRFHSIRQDTPNKGLEMKRDSYNHVLRVQRHKTTIFRTSGLENPTYVPHTKPTGGGPLLLIARTDGRLFHRKR